MTDRIPQPLIDRTPIVNPDGTPTMYFIRYLKERGIDINDSVTPAQVMELIAEWALQRDIIAGAGLSGGGNLSADVTLALDAFLADLNDVSATPPTNGQVLTWSNALSMWVPATPSGGGSGGFFTGAMGALGNAANTGAQATKGLIIKPYQNMTVTKLMSWIDPNATTDQYRLQIADLTGVTLDATDSRRVTAATVGTTVTSTTAAVIGSTNMRLVKQSLASPLLLNAGTYYAIGAVFQQGSGTAACRVKGPGAGTDTFDLLAPCDTYESAWVTTTVGLSPAQALTVQTGWYCMALEGTL